jgi:hypothetical protein
VGDVLDPEEGQEAGVALDRVEGPEYAAYQVGNIYVTRSRKILEADQDGLDLLHVMVRLFEEFLDVVVHCCGHICGSLEIRKLRECGARRGPFGVDLIPRR